MEITHQSIPPKQLYIIGAGGAGSEAHWVALRMNESAGCEIWRVAGVVDDNPEHTGGTMNGVPICGTTSWLVKQRFRDVWFHCAIGSNKHRRRVAETLDLAGYSAATLVDSTAVVADSASLGGGSFIGPLSIIAPQARVGRHVLINSHVGVGHHAVIADYAQLCPGVRVNGGCRVDKGAFLGSNAVVYPGLIIGEGASIGANSFVIRSVKPRFSMMGVPARIVGRPAENGPDAQV